MVETTALGAALAAGFAVGVWSMHNVKSDCDTFIHTSSEEGKCNLNTSNNLKNLYLILLIIFYFIY